ncbi:MAG: 3'-phosphoesterase [Actinobacteria bacterium]|nr:3'-phosphoesterase [Actinomycetota bacterium]
MPFEDYQKKRNFDSTSEPKAESVSTGESNLGEAIPIKSKDMLEFVVHKHFASHLHFDLRLELDGVLKSWAVPKGPSINPKDKKLAVMVEDHPLEYKDFEGIIPEGNYGAGKVYIWDYGTYHALDTDDMQQSSRILREGLEKGHMTFILSGEKLRGEFALIRLKKASPKDWLLIKKNDEFAAEIDISVLEAPGEAAVL